MSLRKAIDGKCFDCIYDEAAAGTKRQQTTLCSAFDCPLWPVRPISKAPIPEGVIAYYGIESDDPCLKSLPSRSRGPKRAFSETNSTDPRPQGLNGGSGPI